MEQNLSLKFCQSYELEVGFSRFRSFQIGILGLYRFKDCKVSGRQSWRFEKKICYSAQYAPSMFGLDLSPGQWDHPQRLTDQILQPFDLQRHTVTLWKFKPPLNILLTHLTRKVFKISFALSN